MLLLLLSRFSRVQLYVTPQTAAHQAPPSLGFSRQEYWSGLPFPSPEMNISIYEYNAFYNIMNTITVSKLPFHFGEKKKIILVDFSQSNPESSMSQI